MKQNKNNAVKLMKLREKVNKKMFHYLKYMAALLLDRVFFIFVCRFMKKTKQTNKRAKIGGTAENNTYRIAVHLEDKRKEFQNCYKLERYEK